MVHRDKTRLVHLARDHGSDATHPVNPPIVRASTVLYPDIATLRDMGQRRARGERLFVYGARGNPTTFALQDAITEIEGGDRTMLFPTGLAAIAHVFLSLLKPGDHAIFGNSIYGPARSIATEYLAERGIDCEFCPMVVDEVVRRLRDETRLVYLDNPGSIIFDVADIPAIVGAVAGRGIKVAVDNTWGAPGLHKPLALGADVSIVALTKYVAGHSDLMLGSVTARGEIADRLWADAGLLGQTVSADDAYMALRGLRTAAARLAMHEAHTRQVIEWIQQQESVDRVLYPPLESDPGYRIWKRDFSGANGLFSVAFKAHITASQVIRFVDALKLFGIGASWGGYESLILTYTPSKIGGWKGGGLVRLHIGLEDPEDLIADLKLGFKSLETA
ncbi:MAG: hypothetical protein RLZ98_204 [Pseudomonadota bacterium]